MAGKNSRHFRYIMNDSGGDDDDGGDDDGRSVDVSCQCHGPKQRPEQKKHRS